MIFHRRPIVVKCGTECLYSTKMITDGAWPYAPQNAFDRIAQQALLIYKRGVPVVLVSSGAVREGERMSLAVCQRPKRISAGVGVSYLYQKWGDAFERRHKNVAQILVTAGNLGNGGERRSIAATIATCHESGVMPVINENDIIADSEHCIGDNDTLARMIAELVCADAVLFLTHAGGVYEEDPRRNPCARRYAEIDPRTALTNPWLTGGIAKKMTEAVLCFAAGMRVAIAGVENDTILRFAAGESVGTMIGDAVRFC